MSSVAVTMQHAIPPELQRAVDDLCGPERRKVYSVAGEHVANAVRKYLRRIAPSNHKTALSFEPAAKPTGHLEKAARNTIWAFNQDQALVSVTSPGITRAFHDLDIRAKGKMLTIPARPSPEAYGKRAREVALMEPLFFVKSKTGGGFLATGDRSKATPAGRGARPHRPERVRPRKPNRPYPTAGIDGIRPVFWLRASVHVPQKRDILPNDATLAKEATSGVARGVRAIFRNHGVEAK